MKKTILFFIALAISFTSTVNAQKVKKEVVGTYKFTQLPIDTRLVGQKTYKVVGRGDNIDSYERDKMQSAINLQGFEEKDRDADEVDFKLNIEMYNIKFGDSERKKRVQTTKKDGVETSTNYYYYTCPATFKYTYKLYLGSEEIVNDAISGKEAVTGKESTSGSDAYDNFKSAKSSYKESLTSKKVGSINSRINNKFCFPVKTTKLRSAHLKPKKHNYDDYDAVFVNMKEGYLIAAGDENNLADAKEPLMKAVEGFKTILKEADPENKKARINKDITALLLNNIGHCYFLMKEYKLATETYTQGTEYKKSLLDLKSMAKKAADLQKRVEANKI